MTRAVFLLLLALAFVQCLAVGGRGGTGDAQVADDEIKALVEPFRDEAQNRAQALGWNGIFQKWEAKSVKKQVVAGTNYFVKVEINSVGECVHLRIYKPLPHTKKPNELAGVLTGHTLESQLAYFESELAYVDARAEGGAVPTVGGIGDAELADNEIKALVEPFRDEALNRALALGRLGWNGIFQKWEAKSVKKQVVAGTNYFVKVEIDSYGECVHLRIFKPLPHTNKPNELAGVLTGHTLESELAYFDARAEGGEL